MANMNDKISGDTSPGLLFKLFYLSTNWIRNWAAMKDINDDSSKRTLILIVLILLFGLLILITDARAGCLFDCMFEPGKKCVNDVCVEQTVTTPTTTPLPAPLSSDIRLRLVPHAEVVGVNVDCSKMDLKSVKIYLTRKTPLPFAYYYSSIFYFTKTLSDTTNISYYFAQKDLLNRYVFLYLYPNEEPKAQFYGQDMAFNQWENVAFKEFLASKTCEELKSSGLYFSCGVATKSDRTDLESATFTFK